MKTVITACLLFCVYFVQGQCSTLGRDADQHIGQTCDITGSVMLVSYLSQQSKSPTIIQFGDKTADFQVIIWSKSYPKIYQKAMNWKDAKIKVANGKIIDYKGIPTVYYNPNVQFKILKPAPLVKKETEADLLK